MSKRLLAVIAGLLATAGHVDGHDVEAPPGADPVRYGHRKGVVVPEGAIRSDAMARAATVFSPAVDAIAARIDLATYDGYLQGLSGWTPVTIGGSPATIQTRHSTTPAGQTCWQYVYETLQSIGYTVSYQNYTRNGNNLKNIVATIPGEVTPDRIYVLGGHLDSISQNPSVSARGAEDNASGSAGILAAAEALVGERFESTIELVLFTGEEQGLWGSTAYVNEAVANNRNVQSAVTFDMIAAWNTNYGVLIEGEPAWQPLMFLMADAVDTYTSISRQFSYFSFGSDHVPFQDAGIPAILAIDLDWGSYAPYHTASDTYDKTTPALGLEIARAGLAAVAHQAVPLGPVAVGWTPVAVTGTAVPNPARQSVTATFMLPAGSMASREVQVFDVSGRLVASFPSDDTATLDDGRAAVSATWNLQDSSGGRAPQGHYWLQFGRVSQKVVVSR